MAEGFMRKHAGRLGRQNDRIFPGLYRDRIPQEIGLLSDGSTDRLLQALKLLKTGPAFLPVAGEFL